MGLVGDRAKRHANQEITFCGSAGSVLQIHYRKSYEICLKFQASANDRVAKNTRTSQSWLVQLTAWHGTVSICKCSLLTGLINQSTLAVNGPVRAFGLEQPHSTHGLLCFCALCLGVIRWAIKFSSYRFVYLFCRSRQIIFIAFNIFSYVFLSYSRIPVGFPCENFLFFGPISVQIHIFSPSSCFVCVFTTACNHASW